MKKIYICALFFTLVFSVHYLAFAGVQTLHFYGYMKCEGNNAGKQYIDIDYVQVKFASKNCIDIKTCKKPIINENKKIRRLDITNNGVSFPYVSIRTLKKNSSIYEKFINNPGLVDIEKNTLADDRQGYITFMVNPKHIHEILALSKSYSKLVRVGIESGMNDTNTIYDS